MVDAPARAWFPPTDLELAVRYGKVSEKDTEYVRADLVPDWRPIETAPRGTDNAPFLVGSERHHGMEVVKSVRSCGFKPTHWQPLSAPPAPAENETP